jgi:hypothetical protein
LVLYLLPIRALYPQTNPGSGRGWRNRFSSHRYAGIRTAADMMHVK